MTRIVLPRQEVLICLVGKEQGGGRQSVLGCLPWGDAHKIDLWLLQGTDVFKSTLSALLLGKSLRKRLKQGKRKHF